MAGTAEWHVHLGLGVHIGAEWHKNLSLEVQVGAEWQVQLSGMYTLVWGFI